MAKPAPFEIDLEVLEALPPDEYREEMARVAILKRELEGNPLWGYVPHPGQVRFHEADRHTAAIVAGNRFGKTHAGVVDNLIQTLPLEHLPPWLHRFKRWGIDEPFFCRVVVVDLPNALTKVMLPKIRSLVPPAALQGGRWEKAWNDRNRMLTFADGSWWDFLTHDMDVAAYAGAALHRVHFDEEPPGEKGRAQFDESESRLVDYNGEVRFTLTPLLGLNWVYYELTDDGHPRNDEECVVVTGSMEDNPHVPPEQRERLVKRWAKEPLKLQARMHGHFVHFAGLVYDEFREDQHVTPDRPVPRRDEESKPSVPIYAAIDPGIDHPAALVMAWLDAEDVLEVFFAEKWRDATTADVALEWKKVCELGRFRPRYTVIDPSARNRNPQTGRNTQQVLAEHGVPTLPGQNARVAGFDRVKERLRTDRLVVHASCEQLIDEFRKYRWKQHRTQSEDAGRPGDVIKSNDDLLDALRYLVMSMPTKAPAEHAAPLDESPATRAFRERIKHLGNRRKTVRIGGRAT